MSVNRKLLKNTNNSFQLFSQKGGRGRSVTFKSLNEAANNGFGKYPANGVEYTSCGPSNQQGGGYGFTNESVQDAGVFRGSYPKYTKYTQKNQCGGRKRRRRKSMKKKKRGRKRRKSRKMTCKKCKKIKYKNCKHVCKKRKSRKRKSMRRKSKNKRKRKSTRRRRRRTMRGGSSFNYASPSPNENMPWANGPLSIQKMPPTCYDNYNHFTGKYKQ